ncbi:MAG: NAD(P)-binding domain-containing protein [Actinomycetota bacterium]|nr:NAD(P)-binding domain-containing protein [Actinomycetota bacterium]
MTITEAAPRTEVAAITKLPVVIIGAGPVGLAAAAELLERGIEPLVLEQGGQAGAAILEWGHIRLFSPWKHVTDPAAVRLLRSTHWEPPHPEALPTGREFVKYYLEPLAATESLRDRIRYGIHVEAVSRLGMDRTRSAGRAQAPFVIRISGAPDEIRARAVIDASGTFSQPNGVIASGFRPRDAHAVAPFLTHGLPDVLGTDQARFAGKHTVVVGAGHSAANTLIALARLAERAPGATVTWVIRNETPIRVYGSEDDELDGRASIGAATHDLVESGKVALLNRFLVDDVVPAEGGRVSIVGTRAGEAASMDADTVVVATGFHPELDSLREIRLGLDDVIEAPVRLAPLIDPNLHSCGTVPPHGVVELSHPEPGFWLAGMKSYGRAPTFLLLTGYEQVRSIADELAGNHDAARLIQLVLPETGVCSTGQSSTCCR